MPSQKTGMLIEDLANLCTSGQDHARGGEAVQQQGRFGEVVDHLGCLIGALLIRRGEGTVGILFQATYLPFFQVSQNKIISNFPKFLLKERNIFFATMLQGCRKTGEAWKF